VLMCSVSQDSPALEWRHHWPSHRDPGVGAGSRQESRRWQVHVSATAQAILPLSMFLLLVLFGCLRDRLPNTDAVCLGLCFLLLGLTIFPMVLHWESPIGHARRRNVALCL
jgi:hypothetical protein